VKKYWLKILIWAISSAVMVFVWVFSNTSYNNREISSINIKINYNDCDTLILSSDIKKEIADLVENKKISQTDAKQIEIRCNNNPWVKSTEVFQTISRDINIIITQRKPLLRIWKDHGQSWYMDNCGLFPIREGFPVRVPQVIGFVPITNEILAINMCEKSNEISVYKSSVYYNLLNLSNYIKQDEFLNALIEQIYVNEYEEFILEPKMFNHTIEFGSIDEMEMKFQKLKSIYKYLITFNKINTYKSINLKFKDQVVCKKHLLTN